MPAANDSTAGTLGFPKGLKLWVQSALYMHNLKKKIEELHS